MSRYTYAGDYQNPADSYFVKEVDDHFEIWVRSPRAKDGSAEADRPHTSKREYFDYEDAEAAIEAIGETFEADYSEYLEENHHEIARMEAYEAFRNEY